MAFMDASEEGAIPRPGYKMPWVYVVQPNDAKPNSPIAYVWGLYSQGSRSTRPVETGTAPTIEEARAAAREAARQKETWK